MPTLALVVLAHKNATQVSRLARRLRGPDARLYVHVDRGASEETYTQMQLALADVPNTVWLDRRYTHWGSFALVKATLAGLRRALADGADYAMLLSGQDYPIKPMACLRKFLAANAGKSFIRWYPFPSPEWPSDGLERLKRWHFQLELPENPLRRKLNSALVRTFRALQPERRIPLDVRPYGGPQWWCLHRDAIQAAIEFEVRRPEASRFFRHVRIPDEAYFQTALLNSPVRETLVNRTLTFVDWDGPPYPRVLGEQDLPALRASDAFFARKFDITVAASVLDAVDAQLLG